MLIQVDVDNTLYFSDVCFKEAAKEFGIDWPERYTTWFTPEDIGLDVDTLLAVFEKAHGPGYIEKNVPYPNASVVLEGLVRDYDDLEIAYISDRSEELRQPLYEWLERWGFLSSPDQHVEATKDKRHWMREHRPEIVIDDRPRTILMSKYELGATVVSLEHPYNVNFKRDLDDVYIVSDWLEIDKVLRNTVLPAVHDKALSRELA
jgi:hypothetical protein